MLLVSLFLPFIMWSFWCYSSFIHLCYLLPSSSSNFPFLFLIKSLLISFLYFILSDLLFFIKLSPSLPSLPTLSFLHLPFLLLPFILLSPFPPLPSFNPSPSPPSLPHYPSPLFLPPPPPLFSFPSPSMPSLCFPMKTQHIIIMFRRRSDRKSWSHKQNKPKSYVI